MLNARFYVYDDFFSFFFQFRRCAMEFPKNINFILYSGLILIEKTNGSAELFFLSFSPSLFLHSLFIRHIYATHTGVKQFNAMESIYWALSLKPFQPFSPFGFLIGRIEKLLFVANRMELEVLWSPKSLVFGNLFNRSISLTVFTTSHNNIRWFFYFTLFFLETYWVVRTFVFTYMLEHTLISIVIVSLAVATILFFCVLFSSCFDELIFFRLWFKLIKVWRYIS